MSSIEKFTLLEERGRIPFSIVFAAKARTGVDHADFDKFVIGPSWKPMVADYGSKQFREGASVRFTLPIAKKSAHD